MVLKIPVSLLRRINVLVIITKLEYYKETKYAYAAELYQACLIDIMIPTTLHVEDDKKYFSF